MRVDAQLRNGMLYGLAAAATFGASAPLAKRLLEDARPQLLAGLLYLGAFVGLTAVRPLRRSHREARLRRADVPLLAGLTIAGGVLAPVLLLVGLARVSGTTGSLLLNLEGPCTLLLGVFVFGEHLAKRAWVGTFVVFAAATILGVEAGRVSGAIAGGALIAAACVFWGIDNNLTQRLSGRDPLSIVTTKSLVAATTNLGLALALGSRFPASGVIVAALVVGAVGYGLSIVLDAYALRLLGAAREAGLFATAPFIGAMLAVPIFGTLPTAVQYAAGALMMCGAGLIVSEHHEHEHRHDAMVHDHLHTHDDLHHQHEHAPGVDPRQPHSHEHSHEPVLHAHRHVSDAHHRHRH